MDMTPGRPGAGLRAGAGYADDAIIVTWVLRSVVGRAGPDAVRRQWPGSQDGLDAVWRLCRLGSVQPHG
jgi:hypothetical protein